MKVGDYVRTNDGYISNTSNINDKKIYNDSFLKLGIIKKSSPNIIDLIEVGDYVDGFKVDNVDNDRVEFFENDGIWYLENEDIKSIVTKEQFANIEYKI